MWLGYIRVDLVWYGYVRPHLECYGYVPSGHSLDNSRVKDVNQTRQNDN